MHDPATTFLLLSRLLIVRIIDLEASISYGLRLKHYKPLCDLTIDPRLSN